MSKDGLVIVAGMGEVGKALHAILARTYTCVGIDLEPVSVNQPCKVLHICYPYQTKDFIGESVSYIAKYRPVLTIVNSTVIPGTTRKLQEASQATLAYSPVRGKHARMEEDLLRYKKFVAGCDPHAAEEAARHFAGVGFKTAVFRTPEIAELSKLLETTWLGILVGWAQEVERFAACYGATYEEMNTFIEEVDFIPSHVFPGHIGGHCVIPNIELLRTRFRSRFLNAVVESNQRKLRGQVRSRRVAQ